MFGQRVQVKTTGKARVLVILGPTAIGKTRISIKLAKKLNGEIISADSMQIYKRMPILSQAPSRAERKKAKHHFVETLEPTKEYSAANFISRARKLIASILKKGKVPIVVGGSGLYIKGLVDGLFPSPKADLKFRSRMAAFASRHGTKKLHARLCRIDPEAAGKIHVNDMRRITRALEIHNSTGRTMTELKHDTKGIIDKYDVVLCGLVKPREDIYEAINARVDRMFDEGIVAEVKRLRKSRLSRTAGAALGYKECAGYLDGDYSMDEAMELLKKNTRRFAKRQLSWFRADERIKWFDLAKLGEGPAVKKIAKEMD